LFWAGDRDRESRSRMALEPRMESRIDAVYRDIPEELLEVIEPVVESSGFEVMDVMLVRGRPPWVLRVIMDTPQGDGRVSVDRCANVSREIGTHLDVADTLSSAYRLEVSSPGLDRPLSREKDFNAACGQQVRLQTRRPLDGRRRFRGKLLAFAEGSARIEVDGAEVQIPFDEIAKANTIYQFTRADFAGEADSGSDAT
jgi:ribosome maturation factor RimP